MTDSAGASVSPPAARRRRRYRSLAFLLLAALAAGLGGTLWLWSRPPEPPMPDLADLDPAVARAVEHARAEVIREPRSAKTWGRLGMILLVHQVRPEAAICLAQAERLDAQDPRWPYYQALVVRLSDPDAAIAHLRRAIARCEDESPRLLLGSLLMQRGRLDEAETILRSLLDRAAGNGRAHFRLAEVAVQRNDLSAALSHLERATSDPSTRKAAYALLAEVQQRRGDRAAAEEALRRSNHLPEDEPWPDPLAESYQGLAVGRLMVLTHAYALIRQDRLTEGIELLQQSLREYPDHGWDWLMLGRAYLRGKNIPAAEQAIRTALQKDPTSVDANFYMGVIHFLRAQPHEAIPCFRRAAELKPDYAQAYYNLGHCLKQLHDRPAAIAAFRKAIACDPLYSDARTNLGELLAEEGQFDAAEEELRQAAPDDPRAKQLLAEVRRRARRP